MQNLISPGPWQTEQYTDVLDAVGRFVALAHDPTSDVGTAREYANARLIAAAPDLLAALRIATDCGYSDAIQAGLTDAEVKAEPWYIAAQAAIAKAGA